jgi:type II secretory pathway pseudopilin PulG
MTLVEMAVGVLVLGIMLFVLAGFARTTRQEAKRDLAVRMLCALDEALGSYMQQYGAPPPGEPNGQANRAIGMLLACGASKSRLESLPAALWRTEAGRTTLVDPWGTPLRYVTDRHESAQMRNRVETNGEPPGRPIFDSAGADRQFGSVEARPDGADIWGEECLLESSP